MVTVKKMNLLSMALVACMSVVPAVQAQSFSFVQDVPKYVVLHGVSPEEVTKAVAEGIAKAEGYASLAAKPFKARLWEFVKANPKESALAVLATGTALFCSYYFGKLVGGWGKETVKDSKEITGAILVGEDRKIYYQRR